ncbi:hypothetical protein BDY21DRAFT_39840 [Lineolata rhizophorae]|uniref:Uncharacterized protein n=1 Tax=Lineolata rhizophorae TaxID=578093 RepID=A0A6A6NY49_9PEZI|nr:hypothetical protein BDY21DRAFT_39840 [Lineolata rhizophorae]
MPVSNMSVANRIYHWIPEPRSRKRVLDDDPEPDVRPAKKSRPSHVGVHRPNSDTKKNARKRSHPDTPKSRLPSEKPKVNCPPAKHPKRPQPQIEPRSPGPNGSNLDVARKSDRIGTRPEFLRGNARQSSIAKKRTSKPQAEPLRRSLCVARQRTRVGQSGVT